MTAEQLELGGDGRMTVDEAVSTLDAISGEDFDDAHHRADTVLLAMVPHEVYVAWQSVSKRAAYQPGWVSNLTLPAGEWWSASVALCPSCRRACRRDDMQAGETS